MRPAPSSPRSGRSEGGTVELGRIVGAFGIKGWVRLRSYTDPPEGILRYRTWLIGGREWQLIEGRGQAGGVVAALAGMEDRDAAAALRGAAIEVPRSALPKPRRGEFYWADVLGSEVISTTGAKLGTLSSVGSNGAQDVMVVTGERERLIPFVTGPIVKSVDPAAKRIVVEWEAGW
ncbi:MAG: ribosome maturation factor RimM [Burkholderiales bacterium]